MLTKKLESNNSIDISPNNFNDDKNYNIFLKNAIRLEEKDLFNKEKNFQKKIDVLPYIFKKRSNLKFHTQIK